MWGEVDEINVGKVPNNKESKVTINLKEQGEVHFNWEAPNSYKNTQGESQKITKSAPQIVLDKVKGEQKIDVTLFLCSGEQCARKKMVLVLEGDDNKTETDIQYDFAPQF
mmetsp:Transcript_7939/g.11778  ORF Transcript_7939/g.11778 Transcript_7939/m.11778 type:complete len:110 (+) Transcript_7939:24-353(+)